MFRQKSVWVAEPASLFAPPTISSSKILPNMPLNRFHQNMMPDSPIADQFMFRMPRLYPTRRLLTAPNVYTLKPGGARYAASSVMLVLLITPRRTKQSNSTSGPLSWRLVFSLLILQSLKITITPTIPTLSLPRNLNEFFQPRAPLWGILAGFRINRSPERLPGSNVSVPGISTNVTIHTALLCAACMPLRRL